jgi:probable selenium-dependent hydroxylase accessory protein YqeC
MRLREAFGIGARELVALAGGGGKTSALLALAGDLAGDLKAEELVVVTTTTKIFPPPPGAIDALLVEPDARGLIAALGLLRGRARRVALAARRLPSGKLDGLAPEVADALAGVAWLPWILAEADGAAMRPLKAPRPGEPVFPAASSLVVAVVGCDAVGRPLDEASVFRSEIAGRLLGVAPGSPVTPPVVARLVGHPDGILRGAPPGARAACLINKADDPAREAIAAAIADAILAAPPPALERIVIGTLSPTPAIRTVKTIEAARRAG